MHSFRPCLLVLTFLLASASVFGQNEAIETLRKADAAISSIDNLHLRLTHRQKFFMDDDTSVVSGEVWAVRAPNDTLLGWAALAKTSDSLDFWYDLEKYYLIRHSDSTVLAIEPVVDSWMPYEGSFQADIFLQEYREGIGTFLADSLKTEVLSEDEQQVVVGVQMPDQGQFTNWHYRFTFRKPDYLLTDQQYWVTLQGRYEQFKHTTVEELRVNEPVTADALDAVGFPDSYTLEEFEREEDELPPLLDSGAVAPDFRLTTLAGDSISLSDLRGKLVLLDFWYMSCYPCMKALPQLEGLHQQYSDSGLVVLGMNWHDNDPKGRKDLPEFVKEQAVTYQVVLSEKDVNDHYNVYAYPTLYLIDREGKVILGHMGYYDQLQEYLSGFIRQELAEDR